MYSFLPGNHFFRIYDVWLKYFYTAEYLFSGIRVSSRNSSTSPTTSPSPKSWKTSMKIQAVLRCHSSKTGYHHMFHLKIVFIEIFFGCYVSLNKNVWFRISVRSAKWLWLRLIWITSNLYQFYLDDFPYVFYLNFFWIRIN